MKNLQITSKRKPLIIFALIICIGLLSGTKSFATTYYSVHSGNWASTTSPFTWATSSGGTGVSATPGVGDNVIIESGFTVTAAANASIINITIGTANGTGTLSISNTFTVTASGSVTFGNTASSSTGGTISGAGTLTLSGTGGITVATVSTYTSTVSSLLNVGTTTQQPVNIATGEFLIISAKVSGAGGGLSINPTTTNTGELALGGGTNSTYTGATTLNAGELALYGAATAQLGATSAFNIYGGTLDNLSGGAITFTNAYPMFWYGNFTWVGKNAVTFISNVTLEADITVSCGTASAAEKSLYLCDVAGSTFQGPGGNLNGFSLTVNENFSAVGAGVLFGKSASKSASVVNLKNLTIGANALVTAPMQAAGAPINLTGNFTNNGTFVEETGTVVMQGTGAQTIGGSTATQFYNLTINNNSTAGTSLTGNISIANVGILNLQAGDLTLGSSNLTMEANSTITNSAISPFTYIITNGSGTLIENAQSSQTTYLFPVGDGLTTNDYTPMSLVFSSAPSSGTMSVLVGDGKYVNNNSGVNFLDRFWTITQSGLSAYTCTSATGTYLSGTPHDINGTVGDIDNAIWTGSSWTTYGLVTTSPYNVTISGTSINPFGTISGIDNSTPVITGFTQSCNSVGVNVTGGETPYTYSWTPGGATTATIYPTVTNYTCTVTDANAFTTTAAVTVTSVTANATLISNIVCGGTGFGSAQMAPTGGTSPYTYLWTPGGNTTSSVTNLTAGTYTLSTEDNTGCTNTASITVLNQGLNIAISGVTNHIDCTDGTATATASNGVSPYTYSWSDGETNATATGLVSGTYTITAHDNTGCTNTGTVTITSSQMRDSVLLGSSQVIQYWDFNNGGAVTTDSLGSGLYPLPAGFSATSTPGYIVYSRPNGSGDGVLDNFAPTTPPTPPYCYINDLHILGNDSGGVAAGNLGIRATNPSTGAYMYLYLPTTGYNNIQLNYAVSASSTKGANYNILSYSTNGGTSWKNLTTAMDTFNIHGVYRPDTLQVLNPVTSGSGWVARNINFTSDPSVANNPNFVVRWEIAGPNTTQTSGNDRYDNISLTGDLLNIDACNGANAAVGMEYGVGPFNYSWVNSSSTVVSTTNPSGPVLSAGSYTVTVTDASSCTATATTTIGSAPSAVTASISSHTNATCNVGGSATASAGGGITPYAYSWTNGTSIVSTTNPTGNVLTEGTYTVTVTDVNGCNATTAVTITQPPVVSVSITSSTNIECTTYGTATSVTTGGTSPYTYAWTDGETNAQAITLSAGTFTITTTDINGCTGTNKVTISHVNQVRDSIVGASTVIHYWDFNQTPPSGGGGGDSLGTSTYPLTAPYSALSTPGTITYSRPYAIQTTPLAATQKDSLLDNGKATSPNYCYINDLHILGNDSGGTAAGNLFIRSRNPDENAYMYLTLPTTGYTNIQLNYAITASSTNGALYNVFSYSTNGGSTWNNLTTAMDTFNIGGIYRPDTLQVLNPTTSVSEWYPININFSSDPSVSNNPNFMVRWQFEGQGSNGTSGNDRYDNISLTGSPEETCIGASTVTLVAGIKYGNSPYTYTWSPNVSTTNTASNLSAGSYTVTVSDANGCSSSSSYTITQPPVLATTISFTGDSCNGESNGTATANATGGSAPYTYTWTPGSLSTQTITGLSSTTFTLSVEDKCGATTSATVTITQPSVLAANATFANPLCNGNSNGTAQSAPSGGTSPFTYSWSTGATSSSISSLSAGTFTLTVTDANSCSATGSVTLSQPALLTASGSTSTNVSCNGNNDGSGSVTASGGTPAYTYAWSNGATTSSISGLSATTYTVNVTDANNCSATASISISQPTSSLASNVTVTTNVDCNGNTDGAAQSAPSGGTSPYTYSWSTGATTSSINSLSAITYTLTVQDNHGCSVTGSVTITQPTLLTVNASVSSYPACNGYTGCVTATASGGTNTPFHTDIHAGYTYTWSNGSSTTNAQSPCGLSAGTYTVTVTDLNSCTATASVTITAPTLLAANATVTANVNCNGNSTGAAQSAPSGGTPPYTYAWQGGATNSSIMAKSAGTYTITVQDNNGCSATGSVTISQPTSALAANATVTANVDCNGNSTGAAQSAPTGGTNPYTYLWSNGATSSSNSSLSVGTYTLTVQDNHGCSATGSVSISQPTVLNTTATVTNNVRCKGGNDGNATASPSGGTTPYSYSWSNGTSTVSTSNPTGSTLSAGSYTVTVTDANNCAATASISITEANTITVRFWNVTNINCLGDSNGTATTAVVGGTPPYTYTWSSTPSSTVVTNSNGGTGLDLKGGYTYTVVVTDANGCEGTARTTITQPAASVTETVTLVSPPTCHGYSNAIATTRGSGGTPPYKYVWSDGGETTQTATGLVATAVSCQIIDSRGCTDLQTINITQPSVIAGSFSNKVEPHCYGNLNGSMTVTASGGNGVYTYAWSPSGETTAVASNISGATYTVTIQDQNGCTGSAIATLNQPAVLGNSITRATCVSGKATLSVHPTGGTSPYTYAWSTGATLAAINEPPGTYSVSVTDVNHCNVGTSFTFTTCPEIKPRGEDTAQGPDNGASGYTDIKVYPNPTNGEFTIAGIEQGMIIEMYDFTGRKVSVISANDITMQLNLSNQSNGIYLIRILDKNGNLVGMKKVVKTN